VVDRAAGIRGTAATAVEAETCGEGVARTRNAVVEVTAAKGEAVGKAGRPAGAVEVGETRAGGAREDGKRPGAVEAAGAVAAARNATFIALEAEGEAAGAA
jgi:hypothetical protein